MSEPCLDPITLPDSGPFNIYLNEPMVPITLLPQGGNGGPYTFNIDPNWDACPGGICPGATLPPGLTIGANTGIISGTPTGSSPCPYVPIVINSLAEGQLCTTVACIQFVVSERPPQICYYLAECGGRPNVIHVNNDLSAYVGQVIQISGKCFTVSVAPTCVGAITLNNPVITAFVDCCSCNPPTVYELIDCTLQNPAIFTTTDLSAYVDQVIKVCDFIASPVIPIDGVPISCAPNEIGFVTGITGPTTGFYYEELSASIKPYTNPLALPLTPGSSVCVNPIAPFDVVSAQTTVYTIQFFIGATPLTNLILVNTAMSIAVLQWFIDQQIIYPNTTITVNTFDTFNHLNVTVEIQKEITETQVDVLVTYPAGSYPPTETVSEDFTGSCICYTVSDAGTSCDQYPEFTGIIDSAHKDCECCLPKEQVEEPPYEATIPEIDKHTYKITESQCDIDANKRFANAMYDQYRTDAYGMGSCCPKDMDKIIISKELSDLSKTK